MYVFGSGVLIGTPSGGSPINFGLAQEVSLNIATTTKALYGQNNFPVAVGSGTRKMTGKAKLARLSGQALGNLFFGITPTTGGTQTQFGEVTSVPAVSPFTYSTTFRSTFVSDQGVIYAATGLPMKAVASSPAMGQYSVSAGVYTFSSADAGAAVLISYTYSVTGSGANIIVTSQPVGPAITFSANLFAADPTTGKQFSMLLYNCVAEKLSFGTKLEDFVVPFRVIKTVQPILFKVYSEIAQRDDSAMTEAQIDNLAQAIWRAVAHVDPALTYDEFLSFRFTVMDLFAALPPVAQASGLSLRPATSEASPEPGKSISTP